MLLAVVDVIASYRVCTHFAAWSWLHLAARCSGVERYKSRSGTPWAVSSPKKTIFRASTSPSKAALCAGSPTSAYSWPSLSRDRRFVLFPNFLPRGFSFKYSFSSSISWPGQRPLTRPLATLTTPISSPSLLSLLLRLLQNWACSEGNDVTTKQPLKTRHHLNLSRAINWRFCCLKRVLVEQELCAIIW